MFLSVKDTIRPRPATPSISITRSVERFFPSTRSYMTASNSARSVFDRPALDSAAAAFREWDANCLEIGLVNNMPSAALETTERQFRARLRAAADGIAVRLTLHALPDVPRTDASRRHVNRHYSDINDLWNSHLDGLIVTGTEPRAPDLTDEPYWGSLAKLVEWAERQTYSTIWSCLAAHGAVLHTDGIGRRPLPDKCFGVFECARVSDHSLTANIPARSHMPHSRWNEIPEDALRECGYRVLAR